MLIIKYLCMESTCKIYERLFLKKKMEFRNTYHQFQNKKRRVFEKKIKITKRQIHLQNSKSESNIPHATTATEM